jgi:tRNA-modifying protein YgfZ
MVLMTSATAIAYTPQILTDRAILRVSGDGALGFLHNLLTAELTAAKPAYAALLTPQGKILHDMFVVPEGDTVWLDVAKLQAPDLLKRLMMYRLRAKLEIVRDENKVVVVSATERDHHSYIDPRVPDIGYRSVSPALDMPGDQTYHEARVKCGLADSVADIGSGDMFVHEANLDQLNGVSFTKGCYVGQEVVSRVHHRDKARNRILPVELDGATAKDADIMSGEQRIGTMLSSYGRHGLALLRLDRLAESTAPLISNDVRVHVLKPAWARFEFSIPETAQ